MVDLPALSGEDEVVPGRVADWRIELRAGNAAAARAIALEDPITAADGSAIKIGRSDYLAQIDCQLGSGLEGHLTSVTLDRISDKDHRRIARAYAACIDANTNLTFKLWLGWADNSFAYLGQSLGEDLICVGEFVVSRIDAHIDGIKRSLKLQGGDLLIHKLAMRRISITDTFTTYAAAARAVLEEAGIPEPTRSGPPAAPSFPPPSGPDAIEESSGDEAEIPISGRGKALDMLRSWVSQIEAESERWGRKPYLVRDGGIVVGTDRPVPFGQQHSTSTPSGLISAQVTGTEERDKGFREDQASDEGPPLRRRFLIRHVGAPQLKVGDTIKIPVSLADANTLPPAVDFAIPLTGPPEELEIYVSSVHHVLGKNTGFLTSISGVVVDTENPGASEDAVWNIRSEQTHEELSIRDDEVDGTTPAGRMAQSVMRAIERRDRSLHFPVVGEVRHHQASESTDPTKPQFTSSLLHGTMANSLDPEGSGASQIAHLVRNGRIKRSANKRLTQIPYATPFAWGRFGLVLPRYPGMRVFSVPRHKSETDYVDVGSVWHTEEGADSAGPSEAEMGDWWLSLPVGINSPDSLPDSLEGQMPPEGTLACSDITNADGERLLQFSRFTIKAGSSALHVSDTRPNPKNPDGIGEEFSEGIVIEQANQGARISINNDGVVSISGAGDTPASIVMDANGNITINAADVNFNVSGAVNVTS